MSIAKSVARPIATPLATAITAGGVGGDPLLAAVLAQTPTILYDNKDLGTFWADTAATTPATINGTVARQDDVSGNGFHRTQANLANRPILRGTPTGANLFSAYSSPGAGWVDSGGGIATATATTNNIAGNVTPVSGRVYRVRYTCTVTGGSVRFSLGGVNGATRTASGTYEEHITASSTAALAFAGVASFTGTVSAVDIRDASADAVTAPYGLQYDGVDDFMLNAAIDFSGTDAVTVCAGVRKLSDAAIGSVVEFSASSDANNGTFDLRAPRTVSTSYRFQSRGTAPTDAATFAFAAPHTAILTGIGDISADTCILRVNGAQQSTSATDQGTGNYGNYPLYFGRRGGASLPFNGLEFCFALFPVVKSGADLAAIEAFAADRTGVTL